MSGRLAAADDPSLGDPLRGTDNPPILNHGLDTPYASRASQAAKA